MIETGKYALIERERRFIVDQLPTIEPWAVRHIIDWYIDDTRLRVRKSEGLVDGVPELIYKLTQKVPHDSNTNGLQGLITNTYLNEAEYAVFCSLPGRSLRKTRYSYPPAGVDVFADGLTGLKLAEFEFASDEEMLDFQPPAYCSREVTTDAAFTGGNFIRILDTDSPLASLGRL